MGRIRTIKPEFPQSESMGRVSRDARLLFVQLWTLVDDQGRTRAASRMLASLLYPYDADAPKLIDRWLVELEEEKCIRRYQNKGKTYLQVEQWADHQKIDKPSKAKLPSPEEAEILARIVEGSRVNPEGSNDPREGSSTDQDQGGDQGRDQDKDREALVERAFVYYCSLFHRNPKQYTLTPERKRKALLRVDERLYVHDGDMEVVTAEFKQAILNLSSSEFHRTKGFLDWNEQIFRSTEEFEKRINWQKPTGGGNGNRNHGKTAGNIDALAEAERFARERHPEAADDFGREAAGTGDAGYTSDLLEGSSGLLIEGH